MLVLAIAKRGIIIKFTGEVRMCSNFSNGDSSSVALVGKSVGILGISYIATKLKLCTLPEGANWKHIFGVGLLGGIGFTMSIFVSILAFTDPMLIEEAKFAVLIGSLFSGAIGYLFLASIGNKKTV